MIKSLFNYTNTHNNIYLLFQLQVATAIYFTGLNGDPSLVSDFKCDQFGHSNARCHINGQCHRLLLHLCDGIWSDPKYPLLRDISYSSAWDLYRHLRSYILDRRHHRHLLATCHAQLHRPCWCFLHLRCCLYRGIGLRLP